MDTPAIYAIIGGIALLVAIFGGIEVDKVRVPPLPRSGRFLTALVGIILIGASFWLSLPSPQAPQSTLPTLTVIPTATYTELSPSTETVTPTVSDKATFELPFRDDFSDGNLDGWSTFGNEARISSGMLELIGQDIVVIRVGLDTWSNYSLKVNVQLISGGDFGIIVGASDTCNLYQMQFVNEKISVMRYDGKSCRENEYVWSTLHESPYPITMNTWYQLQLDFNSPKITGFINGTEVFSVEDTYYRSGKIGFRANRSQIFIKDVEVLPIDNP